MPGAAAAGGGGCSWHRPSAPQAHTPVGLALSSTVLPFLQKVGSADLGNHSLVLCSFISVREGWRVDGGSYLSNFPVPCILPPMLRGVGKL